MKSDGLHIGLEEMTINNGTVKKDNHYTTMHNRHYGKRYELDLKS